MNSVKNKKDEILFRAQLLLHYNDLLAIQCDSWLSEEEGMENMEKRIRERERMQRREKWRKRMIFKKQ
jgi:hypothetical protein